jgi:nucleotide-binding universal stress UspA family protein
MPTLKHIVFPVDFSAHVNTAVPYVAAFAHRFDAKVTLLCVVPPIWAGRGPQPEYAADLEISTKARLDGVLQTELNALRVERVVRSGEPAEQIAAFARENAADMIMIPTHGHGALVGALMGSVAGKVVHGASCPVWTAAHAAEANPLPIPQKIVCCVDNSPQSVNQIRWAAAFGALFGAAMELLHVMPPVSDFGRLGAEGKLQEQEREAAEARLAALRSEALEDSTAEVPITVLVGSIAETAAEFANEKEADLLIIGRGRMNETLGRLRTEAYGIIRQSPCPVIVV